MSGPDSIEKASRRLALALNALEAAADRRGEADRNAQALVHHVHTLGADRARLAGELDTATARSRELEKVNREVALRIAQVMETIRGVLTGDDPRPE